MTTKLNVDVDEHTEINLIDLTSGAVEGTIPPSLPYDHIRTTGGSNSGSGAKSIVHTFDCDTNWFVVGFITQGNALPPIGSVTVGGTPAVFHGEAKNSYFGIDAAGIALYSLMVPAGASSPITVAWTNTSSVSGGGTAVFSGYAASGKPEIIDEYAYPTGTGTRSYVFAPDGVLATSVRLGANCISKKQYSGLGPYIDNLGEYWGATAHGMWVDPAAARTTSDTYYFVTEVSASVAWVWLADGGVEAPITSSVEISTPTLSRDYIDIVTGSATDISVAEGHDDSIEVTVEEAS